MNEGFDRRFEKLNVEKLKIRRDSEMRRMLLFVVVAVLVFAFVNSTVFPQTVNTTVSMVGNSAGTLIMDVNANASAPTGNITVFQGSLQMDADLWGQCTGVTFSNQYFSGYTTSEGWNVGNGTIYFQYTHATGTLNLSGNNLIVKITVLYTPTAALGTVSTSGTPYAYNVQDSGDRTGTYSTSGLTDFPLPVQMTSMSAYFSTEDGGVKLTWETQSETNCAGFHVWRGESAEGDFTRITTALIPGQGNTSVFHEYSFTDYHVDNGTEYWYKIEEVSTDAAESKFYGPIRMLFQTPTPTAFRLSKNYPNPFNPATKIRFELPEKANVLFKIYDLLGKEVRTLVNEEKSAGIYTVTWDGRDDSGNDLSSGIYISRIVAGSEVRVSKMTKLE